MKNKIKLILDFINNRAFVYAVIMLLILLLAGQCKRNSNLVRDNKIKDQNISAANDSIKTYIDKNGKLISEKTIWILTENQIKKENKYLYDLIKSQDGKIISLNNVVLGLKQDTVILHDTIKYLKPFIFNAVKLNSNTWSLPWELNYKWDDKGKNWDTFKGHSIINIDTINFEVIHKSTLLDERTGNIELIFGEKVIDNKLNVYITTEYPGLSTKSMQGYFIDPNSSKYIKSLIKKNHWFTGFSLSLGISPAYDFFYKRPTIVIGPTLGISIYQW